MPIPKARRAVLCLVLRRAEVAAFPPDDFALFAQTYDVTPDGQLGRPHHPQPAWRTRACSIAESEARLAACRAILLAQRRKRIPPGFDDKVLADWNGLVISALADAARVFGRTDWRDAARTRLRRASSSYLWTGDRLHHSWRNGKAAHDATADGYANLIAAASASHAVTPMTAIYLDWAEKLADGHVSHHWRTSAAASTSPPTRRRELHRPAVLRRMTTPRPMPMGDDRAISRASHHLTGKTDYLAHAPRSSTAPSPPKPTNNPFGYATLHDGLARSRSIPSRSSSAAKRRSFYSTAFPRGSCSCLAPTPSSSGSPIPRQSARRPSGLWKVSSESKLTRLSLPRQCLRGARRHDAESSMPRSSCLQLDRRASTSPRTLRRSSNRRSRCSSWSAATCRAGTRSHRRCPSD